MTTDPSERWERAKAAWQDRSVLWSRRSEVWTKRRALWRNRPRMSIETSGVLGVLILFLALGVLNICMIPRYKPADEPRHTAYALLLAEGEWPRVTDKLPYAKLQTGRLNSGNTVAAANHPPLYYWYVGPTLKAASDAKNMDRGIFRARLMTLALGALALIYAYRIVRLFLPKHPSVAIATMAMVASVPSLINTCSIVYNDALGLLTTFASFHGALRILMLGPSRWRIVVAGLWMALAVFTRISGLFVVAPALLLTFIAMLIHTRGSIWRKLWSASAVSAAMVAGIAAMSGWFYWRNYKIYGDVTASDELLKIFHRKPHGTTRALITSMSSWKAMFRSLWGRLAGGVNLKGTIEHLITALCAVPLFAMPKVLFHVRRQWRDILVDKRWAAVGAALLAAVFVFVPMFMYHAKGGNLNARYAFAILWFPAMLLALGGTSLRSPALAQWTVGAFATSTLLIEELYGRALTNRNGAEFAIVFALKANGSKKFYETWIWILGFFVLGLVLAIRAVGALHRRIDDEEPAPVDDVAVRLSPAGDVPLSSPPRAAMIAADTQPDHSGSLDEGDSESEPASSSSVPPPSSSGSGSSKSG